MSRVGFFPYPTAADALDLACTPSTENVELITDTTVYAFETPENASFTFELELLVPDGVLATVLPPAERKSPPVAPVVAVRSIQSRYRDLVQLVAVKGEGGLYRSTLVLPKHDFFGDVHLEPSLIRTAPGSDAGYAQHLGAKVAWGPTVTVVVDEPPVPAGAYLEIKWEDFFQGGNPRRKKHSDNLYYLDLEPETPVLWLNEHIADFRQVMQTKGPRGYARRVRDSTMDTIASQVWTTLLSKAVTALAIRIATAEENDEEDPLESLSEWEQRVIHFWAPRLYPGQGKDDAIDQVRDAARRYTVLLPELMENMSSAVQEWLKSAEVFRSIVRLISREGV